ncbi:MAG TPA: hypothetical protein PKY58_02435 [Syntrophales bacterium]|nr:hypothetical protein [Syntrophales bacterium]HPX10998.1 hypothetical protein [Syntrophales bacterium]HQB30752.1 hypothetical protein [Syntrophales bacterium]HQN77030.1 hypothetical protein [Syntrophales bacterium]HQQ26359.1 hypothetical protein [Syntrophales bacterium]
MRTFRTLILAAVLTLAGAQALQAFLNQYGSLSPSSKATALFETYQIVDGYRYYTSGAEDRPRGIIGIRKEYTLRSSLWKEMPADKEVLERSVRGLRDGARDMREFPAGSEILEPDGTLIGYWYSDKKATVIKMIGEKSVEIYPPSTSQDGSGSGAGSG